MIKLFDQSKKYIKNTFVSLIALSLVFMGITLSPNEAQAAAKTPSGRWTQINVTGDVYNDMSAKGYRNTTVGLTTYCTFDSNSGPYYRTSPWGGNVNYNTPQKFNAGQSWNFANNMSISGNNTYYAAHILNRYGNTESGAQASGVDHALYLLSNQARSASQVHKVAYGGTASLANTLISRAKNEAGPYKGSATIVHNGNTAQITNWGIKGIAGKWISPAISNFNIQANMTLTNARFPNDNSTKRTYIANGSGELKTVNIIDPSKPVGVSITYTGIPNSTSIYLATAQIDRTQRLFVPDPDRIPASSSATAQPKIFTPAISTTTSQATKTTNGYNVRDLVTISNGLANGTVTLTSKLYYHGVGKPATVANIPSGAVLVRTLSKNVKLNASGRAEMWSDYALLNKDNKPGYYTWVNTVAGPATKTVTTSYGINTETFDWSITPNITSTASTFVENGNIIQTKDSITIKNGVPLAQVILNASLYYSGTTKPAQTAAIPSSAVKVGQTGNVTLTLNSSGDLVWNTPVVNIPETSKTGYYTWVVNGSSTSMKIPTTPYGVGTETVYWEQLTPAESISTATQSQDNTGVTLSDKVVVNKAKPGSTVKVVSQKYWQENKPNQTASIPNGAVKVGPEISNNILINSAGTGSIDVSSKLLWSDATLKTGYYTWVNTISGPSIKTATTSYGIPSETINFVKKDAKVLTTASSFEQSGNTLRSTDKIDISNLLPNTSISVKATLYGSNTKPVQSSTISGTVIGNWTGSATADNSGNSTVSAVVNLSSNPVYRYYSWVVELTGGSVNDYRSDYGISSESFEWQPISPNVMTSVAKPTFVNGTTFQTIDTITISNMKPSQNANVTAKLYFNGQNNPSEVTNIPSGATLQATVGPEILTSDSKGSITKDITRNQAIVEGWYTWVVEVDGVGITSYKSNYGVPSETFELKKATMNVQTVASDFKINPDRTVTATDNVMISGLFPNKPVIINAKLQSHPGGIVLRSLDKTVTSNSNGALSTLFEVGDIPLNTPKGSYTWVITANSDGMKEYISQAGIASETKTWNPEDLGSMTTQTSEAIVDSSGNISATDTAFISGLPNKEATVYFQLYWTNSTTKPVKTSTIPSNAVKVGTEQVKKVTLNSSGIGSVKSDPVAVDKANIGYYTWVASFYDSEETFMSFKDIAVGDNFTLGLTNEGVLYSWGDNSKGQLGIGNNSVTSSVQPQLVTNINGISIKTIYAKGSSAAILTTTGQVYMWGDNTNGYIGSPTTTSVFNSPKLINFNFNGQPTTDPKIKELSLSSTHVLALNTTGNVYSWGAPGADPAAGVKRTLGRGGSATAYWQPASVQNDPYDSTSNGGFGGVLSNVTQISAGPGFSLIVKNDGSLWGWGRDDENQLGSNQINPEPEDGTARPLKFYRFDGTNVAPSYGKVKLIAAGSIGVVMLETGVVYSWGSTNSTILGRDANNGLGGRPEQVYAISPNNNLLSNIGNTTYISSDQGLWVWGYGAKGQLGNGTSGSSGNNHVPGKVPSTELNSIKKIIPGPESVSVITSTNKILNWGGLSGSPITSSMSVTPVEYFNNVSSEELEVKAKSDYGVELETFNWDGFRAPEILTTSTNPVFNPTDGEVILSDNIQLFNGTPGLPIKVTAKLYDAGENEPNTVVNVPNNATLLRTVDNLTATLDTNGNATLNTGDITIPVTKEQKYLTWVIEVESTRTPVDFVKVTSQYGEPTETTLWGGTTTPTIVSTATGPASDLTSNKISISDSIIIAGGTPGTSGTASAQLYYTGEEEITPQNSVPNGAIAIGAKYTQNITFNNNGIVNINVPIRELSITAAKGYYTWYVETESNWYSNKVTSQYGEPAETIYWEGIKTPEIVTQTSEFNLSISENLIKISDTILLSGGTPNLTIDNVTAELYYMSKNEPTQTENKPAAAELVKTVNLGEVILDSEGNKTLTANTTLPDTTSKVGYYTWVIKANAEFESEAGPSVPFAYTSDFGIPSETAFWEGYNTPGVESITNSFVLEPVSIVPIRLANPDIVGTLTIKDTIMLSGGTPNVPVTTKSYLYYAGIDEPEQIVLTSLPDSSKLAKNVYGAPITLTKTGILDTNGNLEIETGEVVLSDTSPAGYYTWVTVLSSSKFDTVISDFGIPSETTNWGGYTKPSITTQTELIEIPESANKIIDNISITGGTPGMPLEGKADLYFERSEPTQSETISNKATLVSSFTNESIILNSEGSYEWVTDPGYELPDNVAEGYYTWVVTLESVKFEGKITSDYGIPDETIFVKGPEKTELLVKTNISSKDISNSGDDPLDIGKDSKVTDKITISGILNEEGTENLIIPDSLFVKSPLKVEATLWGPYNSIPEIVDPTKDNKFFDTTVTFNNSERIKDTLESPVISDPGAYVWTYKVLPGIVKDSQGGDVVLYDGFEDLTVYNSEMGVLKRDFSISTQVGPKTVIGVSSGDTDNVVNDTIFVKGYIPNSTVEVTSTLWGPFETKPELGSTLKECPAVETEEVLPEDETGENVPAPEVEETSPEAFNFESDETEDCSISLATYTTDVKTDNVGNGIATVFPEDDLLNINLPGWYVWTESAAGNQDLVNPWNGVVSETEIFSGVLIETLTKSIINVNDSFFDTATISGPITNGEIHFELYKENESDDVSKDEKILETEVVKISEAGVYDSPKVKVDEPAKYYWIASYWVDGKLITIDAPRQSNETVTIMSGRSQTISSNKVDDEFTDVSIIKGAIPKTTWVEFELWKKNDENVENDTKVNLEQYKVPGTDRNKRFYAWGDKALTKAEEIFCNNDDSCLDLSTPVYSEIHVESPKVTITDPGGYYWVDTVYVTSSLPAEDPNDPNSDPELLSLDNAEIIYQAEKRLDSESASVTDVTTQAQPNGFTGGLISDKAIVTGEVNKDSYLTFELWKQNESDDVNKDTKVNLPELEKVENQVPVSAPGTYDSPEITVNEIGKYYWVETLWSPVTSIDPNNPTGESITEIKEVHKGLPRLPNETVDVGGVTTLAREATIIEETFNDVALVQGNVIEGSYLTFELWKKNEGGIEKDTKVELPNLEDIKNRVKVDKAGRYDSPEVTVSEVGEYYWVETLWSPLPSGSSNTPKDTIVHKGKPRLPNETTKVSQVTTKAVENSVIGKEFWDTAHVTGDVSNGSYITFKLYKKGVGEVESDVLVKDLTDKVKVDKAGDYNSPKVTVDESGEYYWVETLWSKITETPGTEPKDTIIHVGKPRLPNETTTVVNEFSLEIGKITKDNKDLSGVEWKLISSDKTEVKGKLDSSKKSVTKFESVKPGKYTLTEVKAPTGYIILDAPIAITVDNSGSIKVDSKFVKVVEKGGFVNNELITSKFNVINVSTPEEVALVKKGGINNLLKTGDNNLPIIIGGVGLLLIIAGGGFFIYRKKLKK